MDEDLQRLERAVEAQPSDATAARRLEQALQRTGRREALLGRYRFKFLCPRRYEDLAPTTDPRRRGCSSCERPVHLVTSPEELAERVAEGACVAFERRALDGALAGLVAAPSLHSAEEPGRPCVVASELGWIDLADTDLDPEVRALVSTSYARTARALPVRWEGDVLLVAIDDPAGAPPLREALALTLKRGVRPVLADPAALERALDDHYPEEPGLYLAGEVADPDVFMGDLSSDA